MLRLWILHSRRMELKNKPIHNNVTFAYDIGRKCIWSGMRKLFGMIVFFIAVGMLLMLIIHNRFIGLIIVALLLFAGYNCFCDN